MENIRFRSFCVIGWYSCIYKVSSESCNNYISSVVVDQLKFKSEPHPKPYIHDGKLVNKRCLVNFFIDPYKDAIWCDVAKSEGCHLLLGQPWIHDRKAVFREDSNTYVLERDCQIYILPSSETKAAESWARFCTSKAYHSSMEIFQKQGGCYPSDFLDIFAETNMVTRTRIRYMESFEIGDFFPLFQEVKPIIVAADYIFIDHLWAEFENNYRELVSPLHHRWKLQMLLTMDVNEDIKDKWTVDFMTETTWSGIIGKLHGRVRSFGLLIYSPGSKYKGRVRGRVQWEVGVAGTTTEGIAKLDTLKHGWAKTFSKLQSSRSNFFEPREDDVN